MIQTLDKYGNTSTDDGRVIIIDKFGQIKKLGGGGGGIPTGPAGGDLSGTYPNPSVIWNNGTFTYNGLYYPLSTNPANYLTSSALTPYLTSATAALTYYPIPTGTTTQYIRGDGSLATFTTYALPIATTSVLGGVKIGTGVSIALDGTISVSTNYQAPLSGTGFVKSIAGVISYDTSTYYLASNPSGFTSNTGTVTSVAALTLTSISATDLSSSVANGTTTPVITLNVPTASELNRGVLSSTDWITFNSKQNSNTDLVNRRLGYTVSTDFLSPVSANLSPYAFSPILVGILVLINNIIDAQHPGVQQIQSAAGTANSGGLIATHTNTNSYSTIFTNGLQTDLVFKLPPTTTNNYFRFGNTFGSIVVNSPANGNYFQINETTLAGITRSGGVQSSTPTYTLTADTWYHLRMRESVVGGTNTVTFNVFDMVGTLLYNQSSTTNINSTITRTNTVLAVNTVSAVATSIIYLDYIGLTFPAMIRGALN